MNTGTPIELQEIPAQAEGTDKQNSSMSIAERLNAIERWCACKGLAVSTVGLRAANNSKLIPRLKQRNERLQSQVVQIEQYIAQVDGHKT